MALDLDDLQQAKHTASQLVEFATIMYDALCAAFPGAMADDLMRIWWKQVIQPAMPELPDLSKLFGIDE